MHVHTNMGPSIAHIHTSGPTHNAWVHVNTGPTHSTHTQTWAYADTVHINTDTAYSLGTSTHEQCSQIHEAHTHMHTDTHVATLAPIPLLTQELPGPRP